MRLESDSPYPHQNERGKMIEKVENFLKKAGWMSFFGAIVMVLSGVALIAWPDLMAKLLAYVIALVLAISGLYKIINYFVARGKYDFYNNDLLAGVVALLAGIFVVVFSEQLAGVFRVAVAIWMIYSALSRMNTALKLRTFGAKSWVSILLLAVVVLALGVFVLLYNGAVIMLIGWSMVLAGLIGVVEDAVFLRDVDAIFKNARIEK